MTDHTSSGSESHKKGLVRIALPLVLTTGVNGVIGVVYWMIAARQFDPKSLAIGLALVSGMNSLSGLAQLNLGTTLSVLVPQAGRHGRAMILKVYSAVTAATVVVMAIFLLGVLPHLHNLEVALNSLPQIAILVVAVALYNIFALQDDALIALRRTPIILIEGAIFGIAKLLLLFPLAALPKQGILLSWLLPMLVLVPVVSWLIFTRPTEDMAPDATPPPPRESVPKFLLDYIGYLGHLATTFFVPIVALELLDPTPAAIFGVAWMISSTLDLIAVNVGAAVTVETSYGADPVAIRKTIFKRVLPLVSLITLAAAVVCPVLLHLYGPEYSAGKDTLWLLLFAAVPRSLVGFAIAECRAHSEVGRVVLLRLQMAVVSLGLCFVLVPRYGMIGMAIAWVIAQFSAAVVSYAVVWRDERSWPPRSVVIEPLAVID